MEASGTGKISGADGEIGTNRDTSNTMTGGEHQSGSNKTASRQAATSTSRHTPRTLGNLQEMLNAGMRHIGSNIGGANRIEKVNVEDDFPPPSSPTFPSPPLPLPCSE